MKSGVKSSISCCGYQMLAYSYVVAASMILIEPGSRQHSCSRNKTLHLLRHAEGHHNVDELTAEANSVHLQKAEWTELRKQHGVAWMLLKQVHGTKYQDPLLTAKGREQSYNLRSRLRREHFEVDAVAVSPMRRTIETALLSLPQLEVAATAFALDDGAGADAPSRATPAIIATELLRERVGPYMPDNRLERSALQAAFGRLGGETAINMTEVQEEDALFADGAERDEPEIGSPLVAARAARALQWLLRLPDDYRHVAVVSHKVHILLLFIN